MGSGNIYEVLEVPLLSVYTWNDFGRRERVRFIPQLCGLYTPDPVPLGEFPAVLSFFRFFKNSKLQIKR